MGSFNGTALVCGAGGFVGSRRVRQGDGEPTRSFLPMDECLARSTHLRRAEITEPANVGPDAMVTARQPAVRMGRPAIECQAA